MRISRPARLARWGASLVALAVVACSGSGGGGGGTFVSEGPIDWGVPFAAPTVSNDLLVSLHNLAADEATATLTVLDSSGAVASGPFVFTIDAEGMRDVSVSGVSGGWVHVNTPTRTVDVGFSLISGVISDTSARAASLGDLLSPVPTEASLTITGEPGNDSIIQLVNPFSAATVVTPTAFETAFDGTIDATTLGAIALPAFGSTLLDPGTLTGDFGYAGTIHFASATPIFAAKLESPALGLDAISVTLGRPVPLNLPPIPDDQIFTGWSVVRSTIEHTAPDRLVDFRVVLRNDADDTNIVTLKSLIDTAGQSLPGFPFAISLAPHESLVLRSDEYPFALHQFALPDALLQLECSAHVDAVVDHFIQSTFERALQTSRPVPQGHVLDAYQVTPSVLLAPEIRTFFRAINPGNSDMTLDVAAIVPQPAGFDAAVEPIVRVVVPARSSFVFSPDGHVYLDRDLDPQPIIGLRFTSGTSFSVDGVREHRSFTGVLIERAQTIIRVHDNFVP